MVMLDNRVFTTKGKANCNRRLKTPMEKVHYRYHEGFLYDLYVLPSKAFICDYYF